MWLYNAALVGMAAPLGLRKAAKFRARGHRHEIDLARWHAPPALGESGLRVVFVALSWGELAVLDAISRRLEARFDGLHIVWAIRSGEDAARARLTFPTRSISTMPFDFATSTRRWLDAVRPDVLVVVEKFWWPNLVHGARLRGARVVLINGRSRGRERARYRVFPGFQRWILGAFDVLLFESESQIERVREVLPRGARVMATGNVKFAFAAPAPPPQAASLEAWIESDAGAEAGAAAPLLIAGSTDESDDEWVLKAWQSLKSERPCRLLIAPRRPDRAPSIAARARAMGLSSSLRSAPQSGADLLVLDTLGELSYAYRMGIASYVGGAVAGRGHNIIEPLAWGQAVSYGPERGDFEAVQRAAEALEVGTRLQNSEDLTAFWRRALTDAAWREAIAAGARELLLQNADALETVTQKLAAEIEVALQNEPQRRKDAKKLQK